MKRNEVLEQYKWKTTDLYESDEAWEKECDEVEGLIDFSAFVGKLGNADDLASFFEKESAVCCRLERLYLYAHMNHDVDTRDSKYTAMQQKAQGLFVKFSSETAFVNPEMTALPDGALEAYAEDPRFADYDYRLRTLIKDKKYVLGEEAEKVLALGGEMYSGFRDVFTMINNADLDFPEIEDENGKTIRVTHGVYSLTLQNPNRDLRKRAFQAYYGAFAKLLNTITAAYVGNVKKDVFLSRARGYESCLDRALSAEDVSSVVYRNLLDSVHSALPTLHAYIAEKKKALGLAEMHMYDMYVPIVEGADLKLEYEDAYDLVKEGLAPLGKEYVALLEKARTEGWIDVYETEGKRSGAYSTGTFGAHPYVLLNYQKTTHDVFTIAHEMGHTLHTYFSCRTQPYAKADYRIFVAEVASTVNEVLLLKHVLAKTEDKKLKKYLLTYFLEMIRTTLFRQTQFAEFEYLAHDMMEKGTPLTKDNLSEQYLELNKAYYGDAIVSDDEIAKEWARIPHFYTSFYVYKYATGIISAIAIANRILTEGQPAVDDYFRFLSSGGSDKPTNLLKIAGVDLESKAPFESAMKVFADILEEYRAME